MTTQTNVRELTTYLDFCELERLLPDTRVEAKDFHYYQTQRRFELHFWDTADELAIRKRSCFGFIKKSIPLRKSILFVNNVSQCQLELIEQVPYYELSGIFIDSSSKSIEFTFHYGVKLILTVSGFSGELLVTDMVRWNWY